MDCDFYSAGFHKWGCGPMATAVFYVRPGLVERLAPLFGAGRYDERRQYVSRWNAPEILKYESHGLHPTPHYLALAHSLDFLTGIGVSRIQARLFALTSRWTARARAAPGFRTAVTLAPDQCAGLVAWEPDAALRPRLQEALRARQIIWGGTEPYAGFFGIPEDAPRSLPIFNVGVFTSAADVDKVAEAFEAAAAAR
jgi:selenocysteine lyase/cysteine desulfurase